MIGLLIAILKGIGWVLLGLLLLFLFLIGLLLFVPIRYRADGTWLGKPEGHARITWLFCLLHITFDYQDSQLESRIRLFGIPLGTKADDAGAEQETAEPTAEEPKADSQTGKQTEKQTEPRECADPKKLIKKTETASPAASSSHSAQAAFEETSGESAENQEAEAEPEASFFLFRLIRKWKDAILRFTAGIRERIRTIKENLSRIRENLSYYIEIIRREESQLALGNAAVQVFRILRHAGPQKWKLRLAVGTGEPDTTGMILAFQGLIYPFVQDNLVIEPDFEKEKLEADFYAIGRVRLFHLLICSLRVLLDKKIWTFIKLIKREETANGRKK